MSDETETAEGGPERLITDHRVGTTIADRYRIDRLLGEGGMGKVYAAEHVAMRKRLAVKVLRKDLTQIPEVVARFEREAMAAANIDHPNVAAATDFGKLDDGSIFLVLEYVEGRSLRELIHEGPVSFTRALRLARQIASALASAHALNIVHRDLKPENIMLVDKGERDFAKVLDFGIARVPIERSKDAEAQMGNQNTITKVGMVFGTPEYMPPEQALGQAVDGRADIYALGVILYELITGRRPYTGKNQVQVLGRQLANPPPPIAEVAPDASVPSAVEQFVFHLLAREAAERPESAEAVVAAIDALTGSRPDFGSVPEVGTWPGGSYPGGSNPDIASIPDASNPSYGSVPDVLKAGIVQGGSVPSVHDPSVHDATGNYPNQGKFMVWVQGLPAPLSSIPLAGWIAGGAIALVGAFVIVVLAASSLVGGSTAAAGEGSGGTPGQTPTGEGDPERAAELASAKESGAAALEELSKKYPKDTEILLELAKSHELAKSPAKAVAAIGKALEIDPEVRKNPSVASSLWRAAQKPEARDDAFALLEGPMADKGADIIYDLMTTQGMDAAVVNRGKKFLKSKEFQKNSSPALNITIALRDGQSCKQIHALLLRAENQGDKRTLKLLRKYEHRRGCGRGGASDCYPCLRRDERLKSAISAIEKRLAGQ